MIKLKLKLKIVAMSAIFERGLSRLLIDEEVGNTA